MSWSRYPDYKSSGVSWIGEIPNSWDLVNTRYLCTIRTGDKDTVNSDPNGEYPFFVRSQTVERIPTWSFSGEAVLTAGDGAGVGKVFHYVDGKFDAHQRVYVFNKFNRVRGRYFYYYLSTLFAKVALDGSAKSTVDSLRRPMLTDFPVSVPDLDTQDKILKFLDRETAKIDALIAKQEQLIAILREDRTATITHAVTTGLDPSVEMKDSEVEWFGNVPAHWSKCRLSMLYSESDDRLGNSEPPELLSVSIHLGVRPRSELVTDKEARADDFTSYKRCRTGDIVLNRMRAFQGGLGVASQGGIVSPDYMVMRIGSSAVSEYLGYLMKTPWFVEQMTSRLRGIGGVDQGNARTPRINPRDLGGIEVALPSVSEQEEIVSELQKRMSKVDAFITKAERMVAVLREFRSALITDAVTGKIDVREAA